jgi:hypothetical protein
MSRKLHELIISDEYANFITGDHLASSLTTAFRDAGKDVQINWIPGYALFAINGPDCQEVRDRLHSLAVSIRDHPPV